MPKTVSEIRDRVANELGILELGQSLEHQDKERIEQAYLEVFEELKNEGLNTWGYSQSVPDVFVPSVVMLVAHNCLGSYGVSTERYTRIASMSGLDGSLSRDKIRKLAAPHYQSQEDQKDY